MEKSPNLFFLGRNSGKHFHRVQIPVEKITGRFADNTYKVVDEMGLVEIVAVKNQFLVIDSMLIPDFRP